MSRLTVRYALLSHDPVCRGNATWTNRMVHLAFAAEGRQASSRPLLTPRSRDLGKGPDPLPGGLRSGVMARELRDGPGGGSTRRSPWWGHG